MAILGSLQVRMGLDTARFTKGFARFQKNIQKKAGGLQRSLKGATSLQGLGTGFAAFSGLKSVLNTVNEFETAFNGVNAILAPTTAQMKELRAEAKNLGLSTKFTAKEAGSAIEILGKNGLKTADILGGALKASLTLSASTGSDLSASADVATDAMLIFGKQASELHGVVDDINGVIINSKFGFDDYRLALANGGAAAVKAKVGLDEFNTGIAATASFFASGETAGTTFKVFMDRIVARSAPAEAAMKKLGLNFFNAQGDFVGLAEAARQLEKALAGLTTKERIDATSTIFGTRGSNFAVALSEIGPEAIEAKRSLIQTADAAEQARKRLEGLPGSILLLKSAMEGLKLAVGEPFVKILTKSIKKFTELVKKFAEMPKWVKITSVSLVGLIAVLPAVGFALSGLTGIFTLLIPTIGFFAKSFASPLIALGLFSKSLGVFKNALRIPSLATFSKLLLPLATAFSPLRNAIIVTSALIATKLSKPLVLAAAKFAPFKKAIIGVGIAISTKFLNPITRILAPLTRLGGGLVSGVAARFGLLGGASALLGRGLLALVGGPIGLAITAILIFRKQIGAFLVGVPAKAAEFVSTMKAWFGQWMADNEGTMAALSTSWQMLKTALTTLKTALVTAFNTIKEKVSDSFGATSSGKAVAWGEVLSNVLTGTIQAVTAGILILTDLVTWLAEKIPAAVNTLLSIFSPAINLITGSFQGIGSVINGEKSVWLSFGELVGSIIRTILDVIKNTFNAATKFLKDLDWSQLGKDLMNGLVNGIKSVGKSAVSAVTGVAKGIKSGFTKETDINSPSRVFLNYGKFIVAGLTMGLSNSATAEAAAQTLASRTISSFENKAGGGVLNVGSITAVATQSFDSEKVTPKATNSEDPAKAAEEFQAKWGEAISGAGNALKQFSQTGKVELEGVIGTVSSLLGGLEGGGSGGGGGLFGSLLGSFSGGGGSGFGSILGGVSSFFGGFRAKGGNVSSNKGYIVGENGPEFFNPKRNGQIIPNEKLAGASSGGGGTMMNETYNIAPGVSREELRITLEEVERQREVSRARQYANGDASLRQQRY